MLDTLRKWKGEIAESLGTPRLSVLTIFVTNRCNAKCGTCFYWQNLNTPTDALQMEDYARIAESTPLVPNILFSGGEPTMDSRLPAIARLFAREPWQTITMPTNGIVKKQVMGVAQELVDSFPDNPLMIGVSFDGFAETHDRIRGVKKNFEKSLETLHALCELRDRHRNLRVATLSVLMKQNAGEMADLLKFFEENTAIDFLTVEALRGQRKDVELQGPSADELERVHAAAAEANERILMKRRPDEATRVLSHFDELYRTQQRFYRTGDLGIACRAGDVTAVLEVNGDVRCCELLGIVGSVRENGWSVPATLETAKAKAEKAMIATGSCACTHCVNIGHSLRFDRGSELHRLFRQKYLAWRLFHSPV